MERVAGPHTDGFAIFGMYGGVTAPQQIIIHAREVIVYQRVGMKDFHGQGGENSIVGGTVGRFGGGQAEDGA